MDFIKENNLDAKEVNIELHATDRPKEGMHKGRFNLPTAPKISVLLPKTISADSERTIVCKTIQSGPLNDKGDLQFFQDYHRSYPPLMYPILFPFGTDG